jgi:hypothetical protein
VPHDENTVKTEGLGWNDSAKRPKLKNFRGRVIEQIGDLKELLRIRLCFLWNPNSSLASAEVWLRCDQPGTVKEV